VTVDIEVALIIFRLHCTTLRTQ